MFARDQPQLATAIHVPYAHHRMQFFKTALFFAAEGKKEKIVKILIHKKAHIDAQDTQVASVA